MPKYKITHTEVCFFFVNKANKNICKANLQTLQAMRLMQFLRKTIVFIHLFEDTILNYSFRRISLTISF